MIQGLKVTIDGKKLRALCVARVEELRDKADGYRDTLAKVNKLGDDLAQHSNDPRRGMQEREARHRQEASELDFIAEHLDVEEDYVLDRQDLQRLGVVENAY